MLERALNDLSASESLDRALRERFSCRAFLPDPVPRPTIERILAMAQQTASWNNTQPWHAVVTSGAATERFREALHGLASSGEAPGPDIPFPREYVGLSQARRRECGYQLYEAVGIQRGDKAGYTRQALENYRLFGAPHVAIVSTDEPLGTYGAVDCGAYVGTFMLAAQTLGVATIAQAAVTHHGRFVHEFFGIGPDRLLVCAISFGFADRDHPLNNYRTRRAPLDEAVRFVDA